MKPEELPPLLAAAGRGAVAAVKEALAAGAAVDTTSRGGYTALHLAAGGDHEAAARALLEASASPDATNAFGQTPLHLAALGAPRCVALLLEFGADIHRADESGVAGGLVALEIAIRCGAPSAVVQLLKRAAEERPAPKAKLPWKLPKDADAAWAQILKPAKGG